jgi:hypothetical protein
MNRAIEMDEIRQMLASPDVIVASVAAVTEIPPRTRHRPAAPRSHRILAPPHVTRPRLIQTRIDQGARPA